MAYALVSIGAGRTVDDFISDMLDPRNQLGDFYRYTEGRHPRTRSQGAQIGKMRGTWAKAVARDAANPQIKSRPEALQRLGEIRSAVASTGWSGRTGLRDKIVMLALLDIGDSRGTISPRVSLRTLCEDTPYATLSAIRNALASLAKAGWLTADRRGMERTEATIYRLDIPPRPVPPTTHEDPLPGEGLVRGWHNEMAQPGVDLGMALGPHAATIHDALRVDAGQSVAQVIAQSGISRRTVYRWLPRLAESGLAVQADGVWFRGPESPGAVVASLGADAKLTMRSTRHKLQREAFHGWVEARAADVGGQTRRPGG